HARGRARGRPVPAPDRPRLAVRHDQLAPGPRRRLGGRHAGLHLRLSRPHRRPRGPAPAQLSRLLRPPPGGLARGPPAQDRAAGLMPPALPGFMARPRTDPAVTQRHQASLAAAERAFSDRAQQVGLRTAFREYGRGDATNLAAGGAAFVTGAEAVAAGVDP